MNPSDLSFDARGLVPVVTQDAASGQVLMLAYADKEAVEKTLETRQAHYYSRSRGRLWRKGATSGHVQAVLEVRYDCDADALLYRVRQSGAACHTGETSCFYRTLTAPIPDAVPDPAPETAPPGIGEMMDVLERTVEARLRELPEGSYVAKLHRRGLGYTAQKVVEEAGESVVAALEKKPDDLAAEAADLLFHLTVLLRESGVSLQDVAAKLSERQGAR